MFAYVCTYSTRYGTTSGQEKVYTVDLYVTFSIRDYVIHTYCTMILSSLERSDDLRFVLVLEQFNDIELSSPEC